MITLLSRKNISLLVNYRKLVFNGEINFSQSYKKIYKRLYICIIM